MSYSEIDLFWTDMKSYLEILDAALSPIICKIDTATGPIDEHLCDRSEYLFGAGFVAIQKYMLETRHLKKIKFTKAIDPKVPDNSQVPFEEAVWAAANYWKHDAEWWSVAFQESDQSTGKEKDIPNNILRNSEILSAFGVFGRDYLCSTVLAAYTPSKDLRLSSLLPLILDWRKSL